MTETQKWEYRLLEHVAWWDDDQGRMNGDWLRELNHLGNDGWEVAGTWSDEKGQGNFLLKRQKAK